MEFHAVSSSPCILLNIHACAKIMNVNLEERAERFSASLVSEIKAEMGRRDFSSRAIGRAIGKSSQYVSDRLDGGSPKTGKRVALNARDISAIASALGMSEVALVARAEEAMLRGDHTATVTKLSDRRSVNVGNDAENETQTRYDDEAAARPRARDRGEDNYDN